MSARIHEAFGVDGEEILAEQSLGESLTSDVLAALIRQDVDMAAVCDRIASGALDAPRLERVVYLDDRHFEFARHRHRGGDQSGAMTFVVRDRVGDPTDIAAWSPPRPVALWLGRGALLGAEYALAPRMTEGLLVHASPLEWLRAACRGVVILDERKARTLLYAAQPLEVASVAQGGMLRRALQLDPPTILVSSNWRAAA
jgi:hypothetical protein